MRIFEGENVGCFSHTLAHCGEQVDLVCKCLYEFMVLISGTFSRSSNAKSSLDLYIPGSSILDYSNVRWFAKKDAIEFIKIHFYEFVEWFRLSTDEFDNDPTTQYRKLRKALLPEVTGHDATWLFNVKFEIAIVTDVTDAFRKACYNLEGDGPLALVTYEQIEKCTKL